MVFLTPGACPNQTTENRVYIFQHNIPDRGNVELSRHSLNLYRYQPLNLTRSNTEVVSLPNRESPTHMSVCYNIENVGTPESYVDLVVGQSVAVYALNQEPNGTSNQQVSIHTILSAMSLTASYHI